MESLATELAQLKSRLLRYVIFFAVMAVALLTLSADRCLLFGVERACLSSDGPTLATELFLTAKAQLVPDGVPVVALGPVSVFLAPFSFALLIAFLVTFPYGVLQAALFLRPALRREERRVLSVVVIPALTLFYSGATLAYCYIIPKTFAILYSFALPMGVAPMFALDDFLASTVLITLATGLAFLLPVAMALLSRIGLVPPTLWAARWRGALLSVLIFSAVVTPDGSGITMAFLALPLMVLYGAGVLAARSWAKLVY